MYATEKKQPLPLVKGGMRRTLRMMNGGHMMETPLRMENGGSALEDRLNRNLRTGGLTIRAAGMLADIENSRRTDATQRYGVDAQMANAARQNDTARYQIDSQAVSAMRNQNAATAPTRNLMNNNAPPNQANIGGQNAAQKAPLSTSPLLKDAGTSSATDGTSTTIGAPAIPTSPTTPPAPVVASTDSRTYDDPVQMKRGGTLRTGMGGMVPYMGRGKGDKHPALYEEGEVVASNAMLDAEPGLKEHLMGLREQVLAAKGMTPEEADMKAIGGGTLRAQTGLIYDRAKNFARPQRDIDEIQASLDKKQAFGDAVRAGIVEAPPKPTFIPPVEDPAGGSYIQDQIRQNTKVIPGLRTGLLGAAEQKFYGDNVPVVSSADEVGAPAARAVQKQAPQAAPAAAPVAQTPEQIEAAAHAKRTTDLRGYAAAHDARAPGGNLPVMPESLAATGNIYKVVDKNGNVSYSGGIVKDGAKFMNRNNEEFTPAGGVVFPHKQPSLRIPDGDELNYLKHLETQKQNAFNNQKAVLDGKIAWGASQDARAKSSQEGAANMLKFFKEDGSPDERASKRALDISNQLTKGAFGLAKREGQETHYRDVRELTDMFSQLETPRKTGGNYLMDKIGLADKAPTLSAMPNFKGGTYKKLGANMTPGTSKNDYELTDKDGNVHYMSRMSERQLELLDEMGAKPFNPKIHN